MDQVFLGGGDEEIQSGWGDPEPTVELEETGPHYEIRPEPTDWS
ncbi:MAG: hypothetical protein Q8Q95_00015 [bacterium]|nr:hypothetical protein [bacterium]